MQEIYIYLNNKDGYVYISNPVYPAYLTKSIYKHSYYDKRYSSRRMTLARKIYYDETLLTDEFNNRFQI